MEELSLSLPEDVELQPVGTVSSIIQQLGKRMHVSLRRVWRLSGSGMTSVALQLSSSR